MYVPAWILHSIEWVVIVLLFIVVVMSHWYIRESHRRMELLQEMARTLKICVKEKDEGNG